MKQFAIACERNKEPILTVLREIMAEPGTLLELAAGTGQHAAYFASQLPHLSWQPTEKPGNLSSLAAYCDEADLPNLQSPRELDLAGRDWPDREFDYLVSINTIHIVAWPVVENLFRGASQVLRGDGLMYVYGPFRYADRELEPSNAQFDSWLRQRDPDSGLRIFERVDTLARRNGLELIEDRPMPANNRSIWWKARKSHQANVDD